LFLHETIEPWSPEQRVALAAAIAERWLPVYETFSAAEQWGDPARRLLKNYLFTAKTRRARRFLLGFLSALSAFAVQIRGFSVDS
jgi:hypothetical protein